MNFRFWIDPMMEKTIQTYSSSSNDFQNLDLDENILCEVFDYVNDETNLFSESGENPDYMKSIAEKYFEEGFSDL